MQNPLCWGHYSLFCFDGLSTATAESHWLALKIVKPYHLQEGVDSSTFSTDDYETGYGDFARKYRNYIFLIMSLKLNTQIVIQRYIWRAIHNVLVIQVSVLGLNYSSIYF